MKKIIIAVILIALSYGLFTGYSWYSHVEDLKDSASTMIEDNHFLKLENDEYEADRAVFQAEKDRCTEYITQGSGNFNEFEYCKKYLELVSNTSL